MSDQSSRRTGPDPADAEREGRPDEAATARPANAAARDIDAAGRPLARQEDEAPGTGAPGVDVGRPDAVFDDRDEPAERAEPAEWGQPDEPDEGRG
jgi:hypothetical protein